MHGALIGSDAGAMLRDEVHAPTLAPAKGRGSGERRRKFKQLNLTDGAGTVP